MIFLNLKRKVPHRKGSMKDSGKSSNSITVSQNAKTPVNSASQMLTIITSPLKINKEEEYSELSYMKKSPLPNDKQEEYPVLSIKPRKKSDHLDYKSKFKTEKCKFWDVNKECKFGENVLDN